MKRFGWGFVVALAIALFTVAGPAWAQKSYDDHEMRDRFYITIGGFSQDQIRTTLRLDATSPGAGVGIGAVLALESLFDVEDQVNTVRLDGWYRFGKKNRISWSYWKTDREGISTYNDEPIEIGDELEINPGDQVTIKDESTLFALNWSYSFLNTAKYEAWLGAGLNTQSIDTSIDVDFLIGGESRREEARGTVPIPTINLGGRWNFNKRVRMLLTQNFFGIQIGDYEGRLSNTRVLAEWDATRNFGIGGGFERFQFEVDAEADDFRGSLDTSYTGLSLYLKGQI
jgi:hypothetical protein